MSIVGVSNGAIQFMAYEELKKVARRRHMAVPGVDDESIELVSLFSFHRRRASGLRRQLSFAKMRFTFCNQYIQSNTEYVVTSGLAKVLAVTITYPYQVVRTRLQVC